METLNRNRKRLAAMLASIRQNIGGFSI